MNEALEALQQFDQLEGNIASPTNYPEVLALKIERIQRLLQAAGALEAIHDQDLINAFLVCEWAVDVLQHSPAVLLDAYLKGEFSGDTMSVQFSERLKAIDGQLSEMEIMKRLRRLKKQMAFYIAYHDINQFMSLSQTLLTLSQVADQFIIWATDYLYHKLADKYGYPLDSHKNRVAPVILGMGKLGGQELNFSSDIDLIIAFQASGETSGEGERKSIDNQQFFNKLAQGLFKLLDSVTEDGIVYRVDLRLRPFGESGALSMPIDSMVRYYLESGRTWERYALIKARVIAGDSVAGEELLSQLQFFVYRDYVDYTTIDALRDMKRMIADEVNRKGLERNVKLGPGGIREIEFIAQAFQLTYGGREIELRSPSLIRTLWYLAHTQRIRQATVINLQKAYRFLRLLENRLQMHFDLQAHDLPIDKQVKAHLAWSMGMRDWDMLVRELLAHVAIVKRIFNELFGEAEDPQFYEYSHQFNEVWAQHSQDVLTIWLKERIPFHYEALAPLLFEAKRNFYTELPDEYHKHLDKILFFAIYAQKQQHYQIEAWPLLMEVLGDVMKRPAYLALLAENHQAMRQLLLYTQQSPWISHYLGLHPLLLDELLQPTETIKPLSAKELGRELNHQLNRQIPSNTSQDSQEQQRLALLGDFYHVQVLKVAMSDLSGRLPLMVVSDHLSEIAEVVLGAVLRMAWKVLAERFGEPQFVYEGQRESASFIVVAYGKLGGIETGYGSDLDLVFLHNSKGEESYTNGAKSISNEEFFIKLAQKMIQYLTTQTASGFLYAVDTRLRPSGQAGLLAVSLEQFLQYQLHSAWTWEHQALIRARVVAGSQDLAKQFRTIRQQVLTQMRAIHPLRQEIAQMREKMQEKFKNTEGVANPIRVCMTNIEFLVQFLVLAHAHHFPLLIKFTDNVRQLAGLEALGLIQSWDAMVLRDTYRKLRTLLHRAKLQGKSSREMPIDEELVIQMKTVSSIVEKIMVSA